MAPRTPWKMPPIVKVYEAIGALADGRVEDSGGRAAKVASSDGTRRYAVEIGDDGREVSSNDNASFWQGYLGYPAIAVMLKRGLYSPGKNSLEALRGIPWREINRLARNDWGKTIAEVERRAAERGFDIAAIRADAEGALAALAKLAPYRGARRRPPRRADA